MAGLQPGRTEIGFYGEKMFGAGGTGHSGRVEMVRVTVGLRIWSDGGSRCVEGEEGSGRVRVVESGRMV